MLQAHLPYFLPQPWNHLFLQGAQVASIEEWHFETKVWVLDVLTASGVSLFLHPLGGQNKEINVYILTHAYPHIYIYFYITT